LSESHSPYRDLTGSRTPPPAVSARAVLLSDFLFVWQKCLRNEGLYTLLIAEKIPELAIVVDERELAYLLTQYGAILTRMHKTRVLRSSAMGNTDSLALLRLAVLRAKQALQSTRFDERRRLLESSLGYLGIRLAYDETIEEVASICMIPAVSADTVGVRELQAIDAVGVARAVTDALREISALLSDQI
jgi:hypothetical protein